MLPSAAPAASSAAASRLGTSNAGVLLPFALMFFDRDGALFRLASEAHRMGLFHRDPKRIVGVLLLTLLNRLNNSRKWQELPFGRQTLHHDQPSGYRGL